MIFSSGFIDDAVARCLELEHPQISLPPQLSIADTPNWPQSSPRMAPKCLLNLKTRPGMGIIGQQGWEQHAIAGCTNAVHWTLTGVLAVDRPLER